MEVTCSKSNVPRFLVLTSGALNGRRVADVLTALGIPFDLVVVAYPRRKRDSRSWWRFLPIWFRDQLAEVQILRRWWLRKLPPYPKTPVYGGRVNSHRMLRLMRRCKPDYILMMGGGILSDEAIQVARRGVLNAHPGLLPQIRGLDAILHSVLRQVAVGVTGHFIDRGIDTGDVICRYLVPIQEGDTFSDIKQRSDHLSCAVMLELAQRLVGGATLERSPQVVRSALCRRIRPEEQAEALRRISEGDAIHLYRSELALTKSDYRDGEQLLNAYRSWWGTRQIY